MITELQLANVVQTVFVLGLTSVALFKFIPESRLDSFRQDMFTVRDEIFDFASQGNISFQDPAYLLLRAQMNGLIRYGHRITLFRSILTAVIRKVRNAPQPSSWNQAWQEAIANIKDETVLAKMEDFHNRAVTLTIKRLLVGSPLLWPILLLTALVLSVQGAASSVKQLLTVASKKILWGPLDQRLIEELAVIYQAA